MEEYLTHLGTSIVLNFDANNKLNGASATSVFGMGGLPIEIAASLPARQGQTQFKTPADLKAFFTPERLAKIQKKTKAHAAEMWLAEQAANQPIAPLDLDD